MAAVSIFRPVTGRLVIRVPFAAGDSNFAMFHDICGSRTNVRYNKSAKTFEITATHLRKLVSGLLDRFGTVELTTQYYSQQTCVEACWNAKPKTADKCTCGCAGLNHGTGQPFKVSILDGSVSVQGEYSTRTQLLHR